MFELNITVSGEVIIARRLEAIESRAKDLRPVWDDVDRILNQIIAQQFASEGAEGGQAWSPLADSTQKDRARGGFGPAHPILRRTGRLYRSLTSKTADSLSEHGAQRYAFGSHVEYFKYHQSKAPRVRLPRRAMLELTFDQKTAVMHPIRLYLTGRDIAAGSGRQTAKMRAGFRQGPGA